MISHLCQFCQKYSDIIIIKKCVLNYSLSNAIISILILVRPIFILVRNVRPARYGRYSSKILQLFFTRNKNNLLYAFEIRCNEICFVSLHIAIANTCNRSKIIGSRLLCEISYLFYCMESFINRSNETCCNDSD